MQLPFITAMAHKVIGHRPAPFNWTNINAEVDSRSRPPHVLYRSWAEVFFEQELEPGQPVERVERAAVQMMARHVYGPVEDELRRVLEDMWKAGMHGTAAEKRISEMIPVLRGQNP